jgi:glycosyltransferase involved in cell wall biosynthesis
MAEYDTGSPKPAALKVLHVISGDLWAGAEAQACTLLSSLRRQPDIEVAAVVLNDGELAQRLAAAGVTVNILDESRLSSWRIFADLKALLRRWQPDIVHTHRTKENVLGSFANMLTRRVPSVRTVHGDSEHAPRGLKSRLRRGLFDSLDHWCARYGQERMIAVSEELGKKLAMKFPPEKVVVIENGVDPEAVMAKCHPVTFRTDEPGATHIGIVGRLVPVKRVDLFLRTAASLFRDEPLRTWRFHVFGDGPLRASLSRLASELGIAGVVTFHGHRNDIVACMAALDVVVMCSDHEGLPMTALEAAVVGVPMVAHAVGGLTGVVQKDDLVVEHDPNGYKTSVLRVLGDAGGSTERARHRMRVLEKYSCVRNADRTRRVYEGLREAHGRH